MCGFIADLLGLDDAPDIPEPKLPAAPAPEARADAGAKVRIGTNSVTDVLDGKRAHARPKKDKAVIGGLGASKVLGGL